MKLSTAIREGAKLRPQCRGEMHFKGASCALGAAYEFATGRITKSIYKMRKLFPELAKTFEYKGVVYPLEVHITTMNDREELSREKIASIIEKKGF